jgi:hypothetical protein
LSNSNQGNATSFLSTIDGPACARRLAAVLGRFEAAVDPARPGPFLAVVVFRSRKAGMEQARQEVIDQALRSFSAGWAKSYGQGPLVFNWGCTTHADDGSSEVGYAVDIYWHPGKPGDPKDAEQLRGKLAPGAQVVVAGNRGEPDRSRWNQYAPIARDAADRVREEAFLAAKTVTNSETGPFPLVRTVKGREIYHPGVYLWSGFALRVLADARKLSRREILGGAAELFWFVGDAFTASACAITCLESGAPANGGAIVPANEIPRTYLFSWQQILFAVGMTNDDETRGRVAKLNGEYDGPIILPKQGGQPKVEKAQLLKWWNSLEQRFRELSQREEDSRATVADQYEYGKDGTVVPGVSGGVKKRRMKKR